MCALKVCLYRYVSIQCKNVRVVFTFLWRPTFRCNFKHIALWLTVQWVHIRGSPSWSMYASGLRAIYHLQYSVLRPLNKLYINKLVPGRSCLHASTIAGQCSMKKLRCCKSALCKKIHGIHASDYMMPIYHRSLIEPWVSGSLLHVNCLM